VPGHRSPFDLGPSCGADPAPGWYDGAAKASIGPCRPGAAARELTWAQTIRTMANSSARIDDLKRRLVQLDDLLAQGLLSAESARAARTKVERAIVDAVMAGDKPADGVRTGRAWPSPSVLAAGVVVVVAFVVLAYELQGRRDGGTGVAEVAALADGAAAPGGGDAQTEAKVATLTERLKKNPDDAEGWATLARAYSALGRHAQALPAYSRTLELRPRDAQALADYADALATANGRGLDGEPEKLVQQALQIDPANVKALALAGTIAFDRADYAAAILQWQKAVDASSPGSEMANQLQGALADARARAAAGPTQP
jgi:cytochrome c-type biogenesis protein CcmH